MFQKLQDFFAGKKTYIMAIAAAALAAAQVIWPGFVVPEWAWIILAAIGLGFLRAGVSKGEV